MAGLVAAGSVLALFGVPWLWHRLRHGPGDYGPDPVFDWLTWGGGGAAGRRGADGSPGGEGGWGGAGGDAGGGCGSGGGGG
jgi:hypothetical protein